MRRRRKKNNFIKYLLILLITTALAVGASYAYNHYLKKPGIPSVNKLVKEKKAKNFSDKDDNKIDVALYENKLPSYRDQYGNSDIIGRLEIPNLNIDTMITRTDNNEFYLNYSLYKQWDGLGVPFFDYRNRDLANDWQINIYGHNTKREEFYDQLPFTNLEAYVDKDMFDNYKDVYLSIDEKQINYEIVAVKILLDGNNEHMKVVFRDENDYLQHIDKMMSNSLYRSENATFTAEDKILVLQVCHYDPDGSYLLIFCKEKK